MKVSFTLEYEIEKDKLNNNTWQYTIKTFADIWLVLKQEKEFLIFENGSRVDTIKNSNILLVEQRLKKLIINKIVGGLKK